MTCHACNLKLHAQSQMHGYIYCKPCRRRIFNDEPQKKLGEYIAEQLWSKCAWQPQRTEA